MDLTARTKSHGERGISSLTLLVFSAIIGVVFYCAYRVLPFYYYYYELLGQFERVIRVADTEDDKSIRKKLLYHIHKMEIPVEDKDLQIIRDGRRMRIRLAYTEVFDIRFRGKEYILRKFDFNADVQDTY